MDEAFNELSYYTLSHKTDEFIHQYVVDTFAAQTANEKTKPIKIAFALFGIYLHLEKNYTGKMVQKAHMQLAKYKNKLPTFLLPKNRGEITVLDVIKIKPGVGRDKKIEEWMKSIWRVYKSSHKTVEEFLKKYLL